MTKNVDMFRILYNDSKDIANYSALIRDNI